MDLPSRGRGGRLIVMYVLLDDVGSEVQSKGDPLSDGGRFRYIFKSG